MTDDNVEHTATTVIPAPPAAMPWYQSKVLKGLLTVLVSQVVARVAAKYHLDAQVLFGFTVQDFVQWVMDGITAAAIAYAGHGRVTQDHAPQVTLNKAQANIINASTVVQTVATDSTAKG